MIVGRGKSRKENSESPLQEKKNSRGGKIWRGYRDEKADSFLNFPLPQMIIGRPLI